MSTKLACFDVLYYMPIDETATQTSVCVVAPPPERGVPDDGRVNPAAADSDSAQWNRF